MFRPRNQRTIAKEATVKGIGYWSGKDVCVRFQPAPEDSGIVFVREDLSPQVRIPAVAQSRIEIPRRTTFTASGANVEMVEHIMAALAGLRIDNCQVYVDQAEMPGCDGSSQAFVDALDAAGVVTQSAVRSYLIVGDVTRVGNEDAWVEARPSPTGQLNIRFRLDYSAENPIIGRQTLQLDIDPDSFRSELASCRTFLCKHEADWLVQQGLGTRVTPADLLVFGPEGPIDNELRFDDECVRHKMLDLVGDLAMMGCDLVGHIVAHRSGHRLNAELARVLITEYGVSEGWKSSA